MYTNTLSYFKWESIDIHILADFVNLHWPNIQNIAMHVARISIFYRLAFCGVLLLLKTNSGHWQHARSQLYFSRHDQDRRSQPKRSSVKRRMHKYYVTQKNIPRRCAKAGAVEKKSYFATTATRSHGISLYKSVYVVALVKARTESMRPRCGNVMQNSQNGKLSRCHNKENNRPQIHWNFNRSSSRAPTD